jgi:metal-dependent amidase/aminoacylase/carboxypeptidase family protein
MHYSHAHDVLTAYVAKQGFQVTKHYKLETAWVAKYQRGTGGRTLGINSEMDALPNIGHACGHNLIAVSGIAIACAVKTVMEKHNISGTVILLGTPGKFIAVAKAPDTDIDQLRKTAVAKPSC